MSKEIDYRATLSHVYHILIDTKGDFTGGQSIYNMMQTLKCALTDKTEINHISALQLSYVSYYNHYNSYLSERDILENEASANSPEFTERLNSHLYAIDAAQREFDAQLEHFYQFISR